MKTTALSIRNIQTTLLRECPDMRLLKRIIHDARMAASWNNLDWASAWLYEESRLVVWQLRKIAFSFYVVGISNDTINRLMPIEYQDALFLSSELIGFRPRAVIPEQSELDFDWVRYPLGSCPSKLALGADIGENMYACKQPKQAVHLSTKHQSTQSGNASIY